MRIDQKGSEGVLIFFFFFSFSIFFFHFFVFKAGFQKFESLNNTFSETVLMLPGPQTGDKLDGVLQPLSTDRCQLCSLSLVWHLSLKGHFLEPLFSSRLGLSTLCRLLLLLLLSSYLSQYFLNFPLCKLKCKKKEILSM